VLLRSGGFLHLVPLAAALSPDRLMTEATPRGLTYRGNDLRRPIFAGSLFSIANTLTHIVTCPYSDFTPILMFHCDENLYSFCIFRVIHRSRVRYRDVGPDYHARDLSHASLQVYMSSLYSYETFSHSL
jgi:hypothetical protein